METGFLTYDLSKISYLRGGSGERLMIAFHGFADSSQSFESMVEVIGSAYVVYVINLPWHGDTVWVKDDFELSDLQWMIQQILEIEGKERFELLGHSFGARIILKLLPHYLAQLDGLHLAAADGLYPVWMYRLKWMPKGLHQQIQRWLSQPSQFLRLSKRLQQLGLLKMLSYKFAEHHLATPMRRRRLFGFWLSLRHFAIEHKSLFHLLQKHKDIAMHLYMGKRDRIIPLHYAASFVQKVPQAQLQVLDMGHQVLSKELGVLILETVDSKPSNLTIS